MTTNTLNPPLNTVVNCLQNGQLDAAAQLCLDICTAYPQYADALHLLAVIYAQNQQLELAHDYFERAIAQAPQRLDFQGNYGNLLYEQGNYAAAVEHCQLALQQKQPRPEVYNTLGNALYKQEQYQEALGYYQQALALQPDYAEAYNNLGQSLRALHNYRAAADCFHQALNLQPDFANAASNLKEVDPRWLAPLSSRKLSLRRQCADDTDFLWDCYQNRAFMWLYNRFLPADFSKDALRNNLREHAIEHPLQKLRVQWIISTPDTNNSWQPIGIASLVDIQPQHRRAEFLIGIPAAHHRQAGAGTTATLLVMDFAFNQIGLNKLSTIIYSDNQASRKNTQALGFTHESILREHLWHEDTQQFIDLYGKGMTVTEFRNNQRLAKLSQRLLGRDVTQMPSSNE